jgi:tetratricopeptide (TPR) repeat protein
LIQPGKTYKSKLYTEFLALDSKDWRTRIRFFEEHQSSIERLELREYFELLLAYNNALFAIGNYEKHLKSADTVIEISILNNIVFYNGEDIYRNTLFKKAASCFHTHRLELTEYILRELLRMDPFDSDSTQFLKRCLRQSHPVWLRQCRAISILIFLISAVIICVEMLLIRTFYVEYQDFVEALRNFLFFLGILLLIGSDFLHRFNTNRQVNLFVAEIKREKNK